ncbi:type II toxin-antitoxin system RelE/ParE family toxin [Pararhizobium sp. IMCC21322]|uniref:type II toxin-antitoxin system RelE/ParE family toxin n=1 Tax=Pararhizobium sp. IMCC21322 TaxID=3067903 RepID=UPI0027415030|nr:type II toxin-antitoxin system RelE/ParE family toxin [Pararhizobium sp. IMCC21322]
MAHRLSRRAERDLKDIYTHTFKTFGEGQADKYLHELDAVFEIIGDNHKIGRAYSKRTFQFVHGKHIILYRVEKQIAVIGRILHGAQNRKNS